MIQDIIVWIIGAVVLLIIIGRIFGKKRGSHCGGCEAKENCDKCLNSDK